MTFRVGSTTVSAGTRPDVSSFEPISCPERGWRRAVSERTESIVAAPADLARGVATFGRGGPLGVTWIDGPHPRTSDSPLEIPKIFIHGAGGNPRNWDALIDRLRREGHRNIAVIKYSMWRQPVVDELGSSRHPSIVGTIHSAKESFLASGHRKGILVGHSYGAALAVQAAQDDPEHFSRVVGLGGFLNSFAEPGRGVALLIGLLKRISGLFGLERLRSNLDYGDRAETQAALASSERLGGCELVTISSLEDGMAALRTTSRSDAARQYTIRGHSHFGLPYAGCAHDAVVRALQPASSAGRWLR